MTIELINIKKALNNAGLQIEVLSISKGDRDGLFPVMDVESTSFFIPGQGDPTRMHGFILCFQNEKDLQLMQNYYMSLGEALPQYNSWVFIKDNVLLQINREVPEAVAKRYAGALDLLN